MFFRNVGLSPNYMALQPRRPCDGTSVSMLVEDMVGTKCFFQVRISHIYVLYSFVSHLLTLPHI
jgi:hypothetical protein